MADQETSWCSTLFSLELSHIEEKDIIEPYSKVESHEQILGLMTKEDKKLYTYSARLKSEGVKLKADLYLQSTKENKEQIENQMIEYLYLTNCVSQILWTDIRKRLNFWSAGIGVRSGFQIVTWEGERSIKNILDLFNPHDD